AARSYRTTTDDATFQYGTTQTSWTRWQSLRISHTSSLVPFRNSQRTIPFDWAVLGESVDGAVIVMTMRRGNDDANLGTRPPRVFRRFSAGNARIVLADR